ncbi:MAG: hypothetical protein AAF557_10130 [Pseudomonadota bacterium]
METRLEDLLRPDAIKGRCLVMWSGGLDSTWTLYTLLRKTKLEIYTHHVNKKSRTDDGHEISHSLDYERQAIRRLQPWMAENVRGFEHSESFTDLTAFTTFARDMVTGVFFAAQAARSWGFTARDYIFMGSNGDEDETNSTEEHQVVRAEYNMISYRYVLQSVFESDRTPEITWITPAPSRLEEVTSLPKDVVERTACCRNPKPNESNGFVPCKTCKTCVSLARHLPEYA